MSWADYMTEEGAEKVGFEHGLANLPRMQFEDRLLAEAYERGFVSARRHVRQLAKYNHHR